MTPQPRQARFGNQWHLLQDPQPEDPTRYPRVNILNLDKFIALAWSDPLAKQELLFSSTIAAKELFFEVLRTSSRILRSERRGVKEYIGHRAPFVVARFTFACRFACSAAISQYCLFEVE